MKENPKAYGGKYTSAFHGGGGSKSTKYAAAMKPEAYKAKISPPADTPKGTYSKALKGKSGSSSSSSSTSSSSSSSSSTSGGGSKGPKAYGGKYTTAVQPGKKYAAFMTEENFKGKY